MNQTLPYRADALQWQMFNIDIYRPPYVPNYMAAADWIQRSGILPGLLMDNIQRNAQAGPVSTFFFNYMAENGWANRQFSQLVQDAADFIFIENSNWNPPPHQVDNVIAGGVDKFIQLRSLACLIEFPALWYYIPQQDHGNVNNILNQFKSIMQNVDMMRRSMQQPPQMVYGGGPGPGPGPGSYAPHQQQRHVPFTAAGSAYQQMAGGPGYGPHISGGRDAGGGRDYSTISAGPTTTPTTPSQHTTNVAPAFVPKKETPAMNAPLQADVAQAANLVDSSEVKWKMSPNHPGLTYPMAYNPITHAVIYQIQADGTTVPLPQEGTLNVIDYDRHAVASLFGKPPIGTIVAKDSKFGETRVERSVEALREDVESAVDGMPTVMTRASRLYDVSLDFAMTAAKLGLMSLEQKDPPVYRLFARIFKPVL
ncbi:MAG TPA: hypothetical protein V6C65_03155, partial [Allocoleopsis sp.]